MLSKLLLVFATLLAADTAASAAEYDITNQSDVAHSEHGITLLGDLYLPKGKSKAPVLVAVHGGAWQRGDKHYYRYWASFCRAGDAVFTIDYRLGKPGHVSSCRL